MVDERSKLIAALKPLKGFRLPTMNFAGDDANRFADFAINHRTMRSGLQPAATGTRRSDAKYASK
jgi:hypothetical protein